MIYAIHVEITSQDRSVYSGEADIVVVPGSAGEMGILPHHSPLLSTLKFGVIKVRYKEGEEKVFTVAGGIVEVQPDQVTILADAAENVSKSTSTELKKLVNGLKSYFESNPARYRYLLTLQAALRRSNLRLDAVKKFKKDQR